MFHPTILPFPDVDHLGHLLLYHQECYLPILQVGMQLLHCCHAAPTVCQDPALFVNGGLGVDDAVSVIQTSDNTVIQTISVGRAPHCLAVTPDGSYVYVANYGDDTMSVIGY
jgi:YVTN family beta-propeller protein